MEKPRSQREIYEAAYSSGGRSGPVSSSEMVFKARLVESDARKAEALIAHLDGVSPLEVIRTHIARGNVQAAKDMVASLERTPLAPDVLPEAALEKGRLAYFEGDWAGGVRLCSESLHLGTSLVSKMTCLQIRSVCLFEMGEFEKALRDIDEIISLAKIYPRGAVVFFAKITKAKIAARTDGTRTARKMLDKVWADFIYGSALKNLDNLVALARAEIDFDRLDGRCPLMWSVLCRLASESSGDGLYSALAAADVAWSSPGLLAKSLGPLAGRYRRLDLLLNETLEDARGAVSETAKTIRAFLNSRTACEKCAHAFVPDGGLSAEFFYITRYRMLVRLEPFKIFNLSQRPRASEALNALKSGPVSRESFFAEVQGGLRYTERLHDNFLRTTFSRLRKDFGLDVKYKNGIVSVSTLAGTHDDPA